MIAEWEEYEGGLNGYDDDGEHVIEIEPLQDRAYCLKWGESYSPGRAWSVRHDGAGVRGRSRDLRTARRDALAALAGLGES